MGITNAVVWRALRSMMRDKGVEACECDIDIAQLRRTRGLSPEIMAADMYKILDVAQVSWEDFVRYFPKKYGIR